MKKVIKMERIQKLKDRLKQQMEGLINSRNIGTSNETIENDFIDFSITQDAFIEAMGCKKEQDIFKNGVMEMGKIICKKQYIKEPFGLPFELTEKGKFRNPKNEMIKSNWRDIDKSIKHESKAEDSMLRLRDRI